MTLINLIGAGRVGETLLRLMAANPAVTLQDVFRTNRAYAEMAVTSAGAGRIVGKITDMSPADIWFLTVPDTQIVVVAEQLAAVGALPAIAVHCSGFHAADVMVPLRTAGWQLVSAHPNRSFADPASAAADFPGTPVGIEGDAEAADQVDALMTELGGRTFRVASDQKALYHAAAVFSNNFATVLQAVAREAWRDAGVPDDIAEALNATLLSATARNVEQLGPQAALTGPAARGDSEVIARQGACVAEWHPEAGRLYAMLTEMAKSLKENGETR